MMRIVYDSRQTQDQYYWQRMMLEILDRRGYDYDILPEGTLCWREPYEGTVYVEIALDVAHMYTQLDMTFDEIAKHFNRDRRVIQRAWHYYLEKYL
jgi:hypothetical protein